MRRIIFAVSLCILILVLTSCGHYKHRPPIKAPVSIPVVPEETTYIYQGDAFSVIVLVEPSLDYYVYPFNEGLAVAVYSGGRPFRRPFDGTAYGFIDKTGHVVIPLEYGWAESFRDGIALVGKNSKYFFIDQSGRVLVEPLDYFWVGDYNEGLWRVSIDHKYGFIDSTGRLVVPTEYEQANRFSEGFARVTKGGRHGFVDTNGNIVIPLQYGWASDFSEGLALVSSGSGENARHRYIDTSGKMVIPPATDYYFTGGFHGGFAIVGGHEPYTDEDGHARWNRKYGAIDKTGTLVVPVKYNLVSEFRDGYADVELDNKWGAIDTTGEIVIPIIYDSRSELDKEYIAMGIMRTLSFPNYVTSFGIPFRRVSENLDGRRQYGLADLNEAVIIPIEYDDITFSEDLIIVMKDGKSGIYQVVPG